GGNIAILPGAGAGKFSEAQAFPTPMSTASGLAFGDFNRDGKPDVVILDYANNQVVPMLGTGSGFTARPALATAMFPSAVAVGDLDGDGNPDIVATADGGGAPTVDVYKGNGTGGFANAKSYSADFSPSGVAIRDFNGDGKPDLAVSSFGVGG